MSDNKMMAEYTFAAKYAKYLPKEGRRETYAEAIDRFIDMHVSNYPQLSEELETCREMMKQKRIVGSQRGLQFGGDAINEKHSRQYNCSTLYIDHLSAFKEALWLLLCGSGVGFSVQKHHVEKLPILTAPKGEFYHAVADSIEGWALAADHLIRAYFIEDAHLPNFDYSAIREKGASLRHGGKAPGSEPLRIALEKTKQVLDNAVKDGPRKIKPIEAFDIVMHLSDAVISGGIRRSATLALFSVDDREMLESKTGNWFVDNPQRGRANISALISPDTPKELFYELFDSTKQFGEPGFLFLDSPEYLLNPCSEVTMCPTLIKDPDGRIVEKYTFDLLDNARRKEWETMGYTFESGVQFCNLTEINVAACEDEEAFLRACESASVLGTVQAAYTSFPFLGDTSEEICRRESLLGVSMTGILSNSICGDDELLNKAANLIKEVNKEFSQKLGIRQASRTTLVKPSGTASIVLESSSGIHPWHAQKFIRRVQADALEPLYQFIEANQPERCDKSVWGGEYARVISFACEAPEGALVKEDLKATQHLDIIKRINQLWVRGGTAVDRLEGAHHNVSCTISVNDDEWETVADYLWVNKEWFTGVSLLSSSGDYVYQQAPFQEVVENYEQLDNPEERGKMLGLWNQLSKLPALDFSQCFEGEDNTTIAETVACAGGACEVDFSLEKKED